MSPRIHPTAVVSRKAQIADDVSIGPCCVIDDDVVVEEGSTTEAFVRIRDHVRVGKNCHLFEHVVLGGVPQDFDFKGETSWVFIEDGVVLRENVTVHRATGEHNRTVVGENAYLMEGSHVGHNVSVGRNCVLANKVGLAGYCSVGEGTVLGGLSGVHQFVRVGRYCMIGGLSKVVRDVPPFTLVDGHPAEIRNINVVGLRRRGFPQDERTLIKRVYRFLFRRDMSFTESLEGLESAFGDLALVREIREFVESGKRGVTPWHLSEKKGNRQ
ncbi:MAG: acyl-ACP--UDP-N-acetylglucosamine O-acyltransferase [Thermovirgaceae bacterium]